VARDESGPIGGDSNRGMRGAGAVLFDLRGTLVDPNTGWRLSDRERVRFVRSLGARDGERSLLALLQQAVAEVNAETSRRRAWFDQDRLVLERFAALAGVRVEQPALDAFESWRNRAFTQAVSAYPDAAATLRALRERDVLVGCVADGGIDWTRRVLQKTGLLDSLHVVVASQESGEVKISGAALRLACTRIGLDPPDVVFVGDRLDKDVDMARGVGAQTVLLDRTNSIETSVPSIGSLTDILGWQLEPRKESVAWSTSTTWS
jgi:putative hydrolase of the HAD superfamily